MSLELWLAYLLATTVVLISPGPTVLLVVSYALSDGKRTALYTVPGVALGDFAAMSLSLAGLGTLLATSASAFAVVKWLGAAYLVYLGVKMWRGRPLDLTAADPRRPPTKAAAGRHRAMASHAFMVTLLNPKSILFFVAFLPQFLDHTAPVASQLALMGGTFLVLATVNAALYAVLAGSIRRWLKRPRLMTGVQRSLGTLLIGAGVGLATLRRA